MPDKGGATEHPDPTGHCMGAFQRPAMQSATPPSACSAALRATSMSTPAS